MKSRGAAVIFYLLLFSEFLAAFPAAGFLPGFEEGTTLRVAPESGVSRGMIQEYVYDGKKTLSRLDWDIEAMAWVGFSASIELPALWIALGYWAGIPGRLGHIEDFDWIHNDFPDYYPDHTHYSIHENMLQQAHSADIKMGKIFFTTGTHALSGFVGFNYVFMSMAAVDGWYRYPNGSGTVSGTGIIYEQHYFIPYIGFQSAHHHNPWLMTTLTLTYSPFSVIDAFDHHVFRDLEFYDLIMGAPCYAVSASLHFRITQFFELYVRVGYTLVPETSGKTVIRDRATDTYYGTSGNAGGTGYDAITILFGGAFVFQW